MQLINNTFIYDYDWLPNTVIRDKFKLLPGGTRKREFALYRIKISPAKKVPDSLE